jgi:mono/diheme cytochrome c family protein
MKNYSYKTAIATAAFLVIIGASTIRAGGDVAAGKVVYENKCLICHGADGAHATGYAKAMGLDPAHFDSDRVQKKSDGELKKVILEGSGKMKPVKGISEIDIDNVIAYVRSLAKK